MTYTIRNFGADIRDEVRELAENGGGDFGDLTAQSGYRSLLACLGDHDDDATDADFIAALTDLAETLDDAGEWDGKISASKSAIRLASEIRHRLALEVA